MAKRTSLSAFAPQAPDVDGGTVVTPNMSPVVAPATKYPKLSVYLEADEIRTLKLMSVDSGKRVNDICASIIREWMRNNGHARKNNA